MGPFKSAAHTEELAEFPRGIHQADVNWTRPGDTFVFRDLIARIGHIAVLNDAERTRLMRNGESRTLLPVSYDGVAEGMLEPRGKSTSTGRILVRSSFMEVIRSRQKGKEGLRWGNRDPAPPLPSYASRPVTRSLLW